jgi:hypothetical protein
MSEDVSTLRKQALGRWEKPALGRGGVSLMARIHRTSISVSRSTTGRPSVGQHIRHEDRFERRHAAFYRGDLAFDPIDGQAVSSSALNQQLISLDTKRKELVGKFKTMVASGALRDEPELVNVRDFIDPKLRRAIHPSAWYPVA